MSDQVFEVHSVGEMEDLGSRVGATLGAGAVLLLRGELGAGKTAFTRGVGKSLGINDVTSPTFVIAKIYLGVIPLVHVDAYRLLGKELAIFDDLDLETRIPKSITVIEWGSGFVERLSDTFIEVDIDFDRNPTTRIVTIKGLDL